MAIAPSGEQFEIRSGDQRATIVEVGAGLRTYSVGERAVLNSYPPDAMSDGAHGAVLVPWPNRLADGRYSFAGGDHQVALTEPDQHNAIHGFLRWRPWRAVEQSPDRVVMTHRLYPLTGYPFGLDVAVDYSLGDGGLVVRTTATNIGDEPCPYGCGHHPYLSPGEGPVDDCTLELPAATRILTDERQLPSGAEPVEGTPFDFRRSRRIGALEIDCPFTGLETDSAGGSVTRLTGSDGRTVELWADATYPFLEVYTGDTLAPGRRRTGVAVEPMTCPPNALQTGENLIVLEPDESVTTTFGVRLT
jgi:aldose 1-epimerase